MLFNAVVVYADAISSNPPNGRITYCLFADTSMTWDKARAFCRERNMTLPIVMDKSISDKFQQFIFKGSSSDDEATMTMRPYIDSNITTTTDSSNPTEMNFWLGLRARNKTNKTNNTQHWFWTNNEPSGQ